MARVVVIGGANVDVKGRSLSGLMAGTSNPGTVTATAGGVARNIAATLARLGIETALMAHVGADGPGEVVRASCAAAGVDGRLIGTCDAATGIYLAILDERGELVAAISDMRAAEAMTVAHLEAHAAALQAASMLVADCNIPAESLAWLSAFAAAQGKMLVIEPVSVPKAMKLSMFARTQPVFAITPNLQQLRALTETDDTRQAIASLHGMGFANVIVHCGRDGAIVSDGRVPPQRIPSLAEDVADVTGAGDAAVAGLVLGLVEGRPLPDAARLGQASAAIKLGSRNSAAEDVSRARVLAMAGLEADHH